MAGFKCRVTTAFINYFDDVGIAAELEFYICLTCNRPVVYLLWHEDPNITTRDLLYPRDFGWAIPDETPGDIRKEFQEACEVRTISPEASAALSRRCLQLILNKYLKIDKGNLAAEIEEALSTERIVGPSADALSLIKEIGNFGAHPRKSTVTGEIIKVEPGEAEANLDGLIMLIDYCFVQPQRLADMKDNVNKKLKEAGKKEIT